jgi:hypothetical protein
MAEDQRPDEVQRWTAKRRAALVISLLKGETTAAEAARRHGLRVAEVEEWRDRFLLGAENALRARVQGVLEEKGSDVVRYMMRLEDEAKPLFCDLYDKTRNNLIETKGSAARDAVRMAIGQLADYSRFVDSTPHLAVLFPARPAEGLGGASAVAGPARGVTG